MRPEPVTAERVLTDPRDSVLDLVDNLLDKGVVLRGDLLLGVANVDLVYLELTALLCAADRVLPGARRKPRSRKRPLTP